MPNQTHDIMLKLACLVYKHGYEFACTWGTFGGPLGRVLGPSKKFLRALWGLSVVPEDTQMPPNQMPNQWLFGTWFGALLGPFGNPLGEHLGDFWGSASKSLAFSLPLPLPLKRWVLYE